MIAWLWLWAPALAQMSAIFIASSWTDVPRLPGGLSNHTGHFVGYALLGALMLRGFARARWDGVSFGAAVRAIASSSIYGVTDEFHQSFVPGRLSALDDWLVDTFGVVASVSIIMWAARVLRRRRARVGGV